MALALASCAPSAPTPVHLESRGLHARIDEAGATLAIGELELGLRAARLGRGETLASLGGGAPRRHEGEIRTERAPGVVEWWAARATGLEHGVTLATRPAGEGMLELELAVAGELAATGEGELALRDETGVTRATYAGLVVLDASGRRVPSRMSGDGDRIRIRVDDEGARYPIVIDPLLVAEEARLAPTAPATWTTIASVAISGDGVRAVVGQSTCDPGAGPNAGCAQVLVRSGTTWAFEATLADLGAEASDALGSAVAISATGDRILVGQPGDYVMTSPFTGFRAGAALVFSRTGTTWTLEATLLPPDRGDDSFGSAVALSADGGRAFVGAPQDDTPEGDAGSVRTFVRTGTAWAYETSLVAPDRSSADGLGSAVAASTDGTRVVAGAPTDASSTGVSNIGSARVFSRTGSTWTHEATLTAGDAMANDLLGTSVAISGDGSLVVCGMPRDDSPGVDAGSARSFSRSGTSWMEEPSLVRPVGAAGDAFGAAVAISVDGARAAVSAPEATIGGRSRAGSVTIYARTTGGWAEQVVATATVSNFFGNELSMTSSGDRLLSTLNDRSVRVLLISGAPTGTACAAPAECASGFCVDGFCCNVACAGGAADCRACSAALTGGTDGTCAALSATTAPSVTCRASAGACDAAEVCAAGSVTCPSDAFRPSSTTCRASLGACDPAETCTGTGVACPGDVIATAGTTCRASAGACDTAEICDGTSVACPGDAMLAAGVVCRSVAGVCDVEETCSGGSPVCPSDAMRPSSVVCRPAASTCDVAESCTGALGDCPTDLFAAASTACGAAPADVCDAPDHCAGTSSACIDVFLAGVECRPSGGACDPAEVCAGASATCPPEQVHPAGTVCRASSDPLCDPTEACDGAGTACPADVTRCAGTDAGTTDGGAGADGGALPVDGGTTGTDGGTPLTDGGSADAGARDAGGSLDAGAPAPPSDAGCACRAGTGPRPPMALALLALTLAWRRRRFPN